MIGDLVLLFNSRFLLFLVKHTSKLTGPFLIYKVFQHGAVELENKEGTKFRVNRQMIKTYLGHAESVHDVFKAYHLDEVLVMKRPASCRNVKSSSSWE